MRLSAGTLALGSAGFALAWVIAIAAIAGSFTPNYSQASQFLSELGASGARHELAVRFAGFLPAGLALLLFCTAAFRALRRSGKTVFGLVGIGVYALGYVTAAAFPCDPGCRPAEPSLAQAIHNLVGLLGYVLAPLALVSLALDARKWPVGRALSNLGFTAAAFAAVGLLTLDPTSPLVGVSQRLIEAAVLGWCFACGLYAGRQEHRAMTAAAADVYR